MLNMSLRPGAVMVCACCVGSQGITMLNKFLCWMWGHEFEEIYGAVIVMYMDNKKYKMPVTIKKCKHCGARYE